MEIFVIPFVIPTIAYITCAAIATYVYAFPRAGVKHTETELMVFYLLWPYFTIRAFVRAFGAGWRELHPESDPLDWNRALQVFLVLLIALLLLFTWPGTTTFGHTWWQ